MAFIYQRTHFTHNELRPKQGRRIRELVRHTKDMVSDGGTGI
jgi:hypothetical protein